jgi:replicative DNA helicase
MNKQKELEEKLVEVRQEEALLTENEELFSQLRDYQGEDKVVSFEEAKKRSESRSHDFNLKTKLPKLDEIIEGFESGDLVVISGPTGQGKTTLAQTLVRSFSDNGIKSLFFSFELGAKEFLSKFGAVLPDGYMPASTSTTSKKIAWVSQRIIEAIAKYEIKVVFIDHLHFLFGLSELYNPSFEIGAAVRELKTLARRYGITLFLLCHLTKVRPENRVGLDDIRDSSFIAQEADQVIVIWRLPAKQSEIVRRREGTSWTNEAIISVEKNRRTGKLGWLNVVLKDNQFFEVSNQDEIL